MSEADYFAFLSYSHRDKRWAGWLHRAFENYRVPNRLIGKPSQSGTIPSRLKPVFRDREELAASHDLGERIETALLHSRMLIVLCSPEAAASRWTNEEIATFKRLHPDRPILAAIVAGEPYASEMPGREEEECFPAALRYELEPDGSLSDRRAEPIAADFREEGDGKRLGKLKLIAGALGVGLDELVQRDTARRNRRLAFVAAASLVGMVGTSALALYAFDQRNEAREQREQADGLIEFMLTDLRGKLEPVGRLDVLDSVGKKALDYYAQQELADLGADALGRRSRALHLVGEVADQRGDAAGALRVFREAARTTAELLDRDPDDWQRIFDHAQSAFWVGYMAGEQGNYQERLRNFEQYNQLANRLAELKPDDRTSQLEAAYGQANLGIVYKDLDWDQKAIAALEHGQRLFKAIENPEPEILQELAELHSHAASLHYYLGDNERSISERRAHLAIIASAASEGDAMALEREARSRGSLAMTLFAAGELRDAQAEINKSLAIWHRLTTNDPDNADWAGSRAKSLATLALIQSADSQDQSRRLIRQALAIYAPISQHQKTDIAALNDLVELRTTAVRLGVVEEAERLEADLQRLQNLKPNPNDEIRHAIGLGWAALADHSRKTGKLKMADRQYRLAKESLSTSGKLSSQAQRVLAGISEAQSSVAIRSTK